MELSSSNASISISNTISKEGSDEEMSMLRASLDDAVSRRGHGAKGIDAPISNERIQEEDELLETYKVTSKAIHGGMGSVWRVHHKSWDSDLAMKRPQPRFFAEGSRRKKEEFIAECENWIDLGLHPNIVSCYYVRDIGGVPSVFSEWMENGSLKDRIRDGSLYEGTEKEVQERILDIAIQAARGLGYSHEKGLIHQDVKPGNLLLTADWETKVADFGLAQAQAHLGEEEEEGPAGQEKGEKGAGSPVHQHISGYTLEYCPKEQTEGGEAEGWMDVYAWALTVLEMYVGKRIWETGADAAGLLRKMEEDLFEPDPPGNLQRKEFRIDIPEQVLDLLCRCVLPDHEDEEEYGEEYDEEDDEGLVGDDDEWSGGHTVDFADAEEELREIYEEQFGVKYPRPAPKAAEDSPASLNNRALSFLDLGKQERADDLWYEALSAEEYYPDACYNQKLYEWMIGQGTDLDLLTAVEKISDTARMTDLHLMANRIRGEEKEGRDPEEYAEIMNLKMSWDSRYGGRAEPRLSDYAGSERVFCAAPGRCFLVSRREQEKKKSKCYVYILNRWEREEDKAGAASRRKEPEDGESASSWNPEWAHISTPDMEFEDVYACRESASLDGEGLVLFSRDCLKVLEAGSRKILHEFRSPERTINSVCGGPDKDSCYFGTKGGVYGLKWGNSEPERYGGPELLLKTDWICNGLKLCMGGKILLIKEWESFHVKVLNTETGELLADINPLYASFGCIDISEDGKTLLIGVKNELRYYDLSTGIKSGSFEFPDSKCRITDVSGPWVLTCSDNNIGIWNMDRHVCLRSIRNENIGDGFFLHRDDWNEGMVEGRFFLNSGTLELFSVPSRLPEPIWSLVKFTETAEQIEEDERFQGIIAQAEKAVADRDYPAARSLLEEARQLPDRKNSEECQAVYDALFPHFRRGKLTECIFRADLSFVFKDYLPSFSDDGKFLFGRTGTYKYEVRYSEFEEDESTDAVLRIDNCLSGRHFRPVFGGKRLACIDKGGRRFTLYEIPSGRTVVVSEGTFREAGIDVFHAAGEEGKEGSREGSKKDRSGSETVIVHKKGLLGESVLLAVDTETGKPVDLRAAKRMLGSKAAFAGTNDKGVSYRIESTAEGDYLCFYDRNGREIDHTLVNGHGKIGYAEYDYGVLQPHDMIIFVEGTRLKICSVWDFPRPVGQVLPIPAPFGDSVMSENCRYLYTKGNVYRLEWELLD